MHSQLQTSIASSEWSIRWTLLSILKNIIITTLENRTFLKMEGAWTCNLEIRVNTSWKMTTFGDFPRYFSYFRPGHNTKQSYSYNGHQRISEPFSPPSTFPPPLFSTISGKSHYILLYGNLFPPPLFSTIWKQGGGKGSDIPWFQQI